MLVARLVGNKPSVNLLVSRGSEEADEAADDDADTCQQQRSPTQPVHQQQRHQGGHHLDQPQQDGGQAGQGLPTEANRLGDISCKCSLLLKPPVRT